MSSLERDILFLAAVVSAACALPGVFLVLRHMSMLADAISHTVLLGIALAFFVVAQYGHPLLIVGASAVGVLTVAAIEALHRTRLLKMDAAIGVTFPALFSLGVLLIALFARDAHLDEHTVFQGDLAYSAFERLYVRGRNWGPLALWKMLGILGANALLIGLFYKELKLAAFDPDLAAALGFAPAALHYGLVGMTSVTAVGAFDAVGSILVIGFMIAPPVTAYLLTDSLTWMIGLAVGIGLASAGLGFWGAAWTDASIGGAMTLALGAVFLVVLLAAPRRGLIAGWLRRRRQKVEFAVRMLSIHLFQHRGAAASSDESRVDHMQLHLGWSERYGQRILRAAQTRGYVTVQDGTWMHLTDAGRQLAAGALAA